MMQVNDLNIEADILPLFDFTNNTHAFDELTKLFREVPASLEAVRERQQILQGFLDNWVVLENFSYPRLYLSEVYALFQETAAGNLAPEPSGLKVYLRLRFSETKRNQKMSQFIQVVLLLNNIYQHYLGRLDKTMFPDKFKQELQRALLFLNKLNLPTYAALIIEDKFSVSKVVAFNQNLNSLSANEVKAFWLFFFSFEAYYSVARTIR